MNVRKLFPAALGLWMGWASGACQGQEESGVAPVRAPQEPRRLVLIPGAADAAPSFNQQTAETIAECLQRSGRLRGYRVDIRFADGVAELSGRVADMAQRDEVLRMVQSVPGVDRVRDLLAVAGTGVVLTAQGPKLEQGPLPEKLVPLEKLPLSGNAAPDKALQPPPLVGGVPQEPMSIMPIAPGFNPGMANPGMQPPPMPPYAWPTYAPYNNYSRVAYPTNYPYEAFPFIGPMYPFPKVPLGWRAVTLRWQDGHWWYGREASGHDWWRIRYY